MTIPRFFYGTKHSGQLSKQHPRKDSHVDGSVRVSRFRCVEAPRERSIFPPMSVWSSLDTNCSEHTVTEPSSYSTGGFLPGVVRIMLLSPKVQPICRDAI
ncbi:hypothetical protein TWF132_003771 [Orbilia oligospora]|nr:hypothetical protein TWF132_003771 [Orbilia oligospora]